MRNVVVFILVILPLFVVSRARAESEGEEKLSMQQRMLLQRMKYELGLDENQVEKVRALMLEEKERTRKAVLELLDEDQKEVYEKMESSSRRGFSGVRFGGPGGMRSFSIAPGGKGGPLGITMKDLKKEVGVTEEEAKEAEAIFSRYREEKKKAMEKMMEDFDFGDIGKMIGGDKELDEKTLKKLRKVLAEERREAFDALVEKKRKKRSGGIRMFGADGGDLDLEGLGDIGKSIEDSLKGLKDRLKGKVAEWEAGTGLPSLEEVSKEAGFEGVEGEVLMEKVKEILEGEKEFRAFQAVFRRNLKKEAGALGNEAAREKLLEFRREREARKAKLHSLKEDLRSLLSYGQEAKLVAMGVLD